jgi:EmrB/QacA subfamily drug resistance transporter
MTDMRPAWLTFAVAAAAVFMVSLDATVAVAAFPALRAAFGESSVSTLSWVINGYTIVFAALLVPLGRVMDQVGHRPCFLLGTAGFTLASLACGLASSPVSLTTARVAQAVGAAMISPSSLALVLAAFPPHHRGRAAGLLTAAGALAAAAGPALGSLLIEWFSWRMIFFINLPIGMAVILFGRAGLPEIAPCRTKHRFDLIGTLLLVGGVGGIAGGLSQAGESTMASVAVIAPLLLGMLATVGFGLWARKRVDSALDLTLFSEPRLRRASLATVVLGLAFGLMFLSFYLLFTGLWHYPQAIAGLAATPGPLLATLVAAGFSHRFLKHGNLAPMRMGGVAFAAGNLWLAICLQTEPAYLAVWLPGQVVSGVGVGLMLSSIIAAATAQLPPQQLGSGSAVNTALRQLGSSVGIALAVALVGGDLETIGSFRAVYLSLAICGCLIACIAWRGKEC